MNLRARFALHAGLKAGATPDAAGAGDGVAPEVSEATCAIGQVIEPPRTEPARAPARAAAPPEAPAAVATPVSEPSPGWSGAYAKGVYRLFVRGRATRATRPATTEAPRPSAPAMAPPPAVAHGDCVAPAPASATGSAGLAICTAVGAPVRASHDVPTLADKPGAPPPTSRDAPALASRDVPALADKPGAPPTTSRDAPALASRDVPALADKPGAPPPASRDAPARARLDEPARATAVAPGREVLRAVDRPGEQPPAGPAVQPPPATGPARARASAAPTPAARPTVDPLAMSPEVGGIVRRVVDWPLLPGARPALLGGALARLELPDAPRFCGLVPRLLSGVQPQPGGSPVVFLDLETTALDRGAGALAFMVGIAALVDGALRVEQWILTRLSSEAAMLAEVMQRIDALAGPGAVLSSFNGASFDLPLLRTRLRRAGLRATALERPHLDLLPPSRRMWRGRGPDCRLVTLERTQLGVRRVHDIAGHEIPAVFWAWLRRPNDPEVQAVMARVADHNLADLVTLPALAAALCTCMTAPQDLDMAVRSAEHSRAAGRPAEALALLDAWTPRPAATAQRRRALLLAAELLRRDLASRARAAELWAEVCRISPGDPAAHEALAKYLEHHAGDPARALEVARASASPCPRRLARLQRKLTSATNAVGQGPGPVGPAKATAENVIAAAVAGSIATSVTSVTSVTTSVSTSVPGPTPVPAAVRSVPGPLRSGHLNC